MPVRPPLDLDRIRAGVKESSVTQVHLHEQLASTNTEAARLGMPWALVLAEHQVGGKGRLGRRWSEAPRAGLAMSVLVPTPPGALGWVPLLTNSAADNDRVAHAIDARFANSPDETSTQDEATFNKSFAAQLGDIGLVVSLVVGAAFAAILLIVGTTIALAVRERTKEVGVMKTLGFSDNLVLFIVLGEAILISFVGGFLGTGGAWLLFAAVPSNLGGFVSNMRVVPATFALGIGLSIVMGVLSGLVPALQASRLRIVDAFRQVG